MRIECYFDGACEPVNPGGHTSYGALVRCGIKTLFSESGYVGVGEGMSNNVAEYAGIIAVMTYLVDQGIGKAVIYGDSKLVVKQMNGRWKAKAGVYIPYYRKALKLRTRLPNVQIEWIPRERNSEADALSRMAIKDPAIQSKKKLEIRRLVQEQREDRHDPRFKVIASNPTEGTPF
jgi:ribonuclease HI